VYRPVDLQDQDTTESIGDIDLDFLFFTGAEQLAPKGRNRWEISVGDVVAIFGQRDRELLAVVEVLDHDAIADTDGIGRMRL
jgi:hypothetical protein